MFLVVECQPVAQTFKRKEGPDSGSFGRGGPDPGWTAHQPVQATQ